MKLDTSNIMRLFGSQNAIGRGVGPANDNASTQNALAMMGTPVQNNPLGEIGPVDLTQDNSIGRSNRQSQGIGGSLSGAPGRGLGRRNGLNRGGPEQSGDGSNPVQGRGRRNGSRRPGESENDRENNSLRGPGRGRRRRPMGQGMPQMLQQMISQYRSEVETESSTLDALIASITDPQLQEALQRGLQDALGKGTLKEQLDSLNSLRLSVEGASQGTTPTSPTGSIGQPVGSRLNIVS